MFIWKIKWSIINPWVICPLIWVWFRFLTFMCICIFHVDTCFNLMCPCQEHCQIVIMKDLIDGLITALYTNCVYYLSRIPLCTKPGLLRFRSFELCCVFRYSFTIFELNLVEIRSVCLKLWRWSARLFSLWMLLWSYHSSNSYLLSNACKHGNGAQFKLLSSP